MHVHVSFNFSSFHFINNSTVAILLDLPSKIQRLEKKCQDNGKMGASDLAFLIMLPFMVGNDHIRYALCSSHCFYSGIQQRIIGLKGHHGDLLVLTLAQGRDLILFQTNSCPVCSWKPAVMEQPQLLDIGCSIN